MTKNNAFRRTVFRSQFRSNARSARRRGFTMLEILTSVTLGLMLMYAVARIFSEVGGAMNETMSTMETANALRNAKQRLTADLEALSVTPAPPRNSRRDEGFFCYVEGMGGPFNRVLANGAGATATYLDQNGVAQTYSLADYGLPFTVGDVALDSERNAYYSGGGNDAADFADYYVDSAVGDVDDMLSFTAKAPEGSPFKGRYIRPIFNEAGAIVDGVESTFESQYAEIIWFVRGTTLYRRVLPLMSDAMLQQSFIALERAVQNGSIAIPNGEFNVEVNVGVNRIKEGCGFYRFYDVSVHTRNGNLVANTLGDLSNRANRYFYWLSPTLYGNVAQYANENGVVQGSFGAWYWLRAATLQESARPDFVAGGPFGAGAAGLGVVPHTWEAEFQNLTLNADAAALTRLGGGARSGADLPLSPTSNGATVERYPFFDFWNEPNVWDELDRETGDLAGSIKIDLDGREAVFNQDVILTNVISFNVRAWDPKTNAYVDLGSGVANGATAPDDPDDLRSYGYYGNDAARRNFYQYCLNLDGQTNSYNPNMKKAPFYQPCVYDTWSEQYERELIAISELNGTGIASGTTANIPLDDEISAADLSDFPPPYNVPLKSLQIEIRVFDPRSKLLRNATFNVDFTTL